MYAQYCLNGRDISGDPYREYDADTVRVWDGEFCLIEVHSTDNGEPWMYAGGDMGHRYTVDQMETQYETWPDALDAFGLYDGLEDR